jgi:hypothetical protein
MRDPANGSRLTAKEFPVSGALAYFSASGDPDPLLHLPDGFGGRSFVRRFCAINIARGCRGAFVGLLVQRVVATCRAAAEVHRSGCRRKPAVPKYAVSRESLEATDLKKLLFSDPNLRLNVQISINLKTLMVYS